jgi:hypothetical protein
MKTADTTYTLYLKNDGADDEIVARAVPIVVAMRRAVEYDGSCYSSACLTDYDEFRRYEWYVQPKERGVPSTARPLYATVPKTHKVSADETAAEAIIAAQFLRYSGDYWRGGIETDADYDRRVQRCNVHKTAVQVGQEVVDALIAGNFVLSGNLLSDRRQFYRSSDRDAIFEYLRVVDLVEFNVHRAGLTHWFRMDLGEQCLNPIEDYSKGLEALVEPIIERHRPSGEPLSDNDDPDFDDNDTFIADCDDDSST